MWNVINPVPSGEIHFFDRMEKKYSKREKVRQTSLPSIMRPTDPSSLTEFDLNGDFQKINANETGARPAAPFESLSLDPKSDSFLLIDPEEKLTVSSAEEFIHLLDCPNDCKLKVISVFGNAGDGKSYILNHTLFRGQEMFKTGSDPEGGTRGVWVAWQRSQRLLCLDTPPLHHSDTSLVLLYKVLAISDVIIYRTRAERLQSDFYTFLGQASKAYTQHFQKILQNAGHHTEIGGPLSARGPAIIVSHEPRHSSPLMMGPKGETPEDQILNRLKSLGFSNEGLGVLYYVPVISSSPSMHTSQASLNVILNQYLENTAVRTPRSPKAILHALMCLTKRFNGRLTCDVVCKACQAECTMSMGHKEDNIKHHSDIKCRYQHQYENRVLICKNCKEKVIEVQDELSQESWLGLVRSAWNGYELHCSKCGPIYKSRQYWFGNKAPEETAVHSEIIHVWPGVSNGVNGTNGGVVVRQVLEAVSGITGTLATCLADTFTPAYWQPTTEIKNCNVCYSSLEAGRGEIHHCRACGKGVCGSCSTSSMPVPHRGWPNPVRVCDKCKDAPVVAGESDENSDVTARKVKETVITAFSPLSVAFQYPKGVLTNLARPAYWTPDEEAPQCAECNVSFGVGLENATRHHCRKCGRCVCSNCSPHRKSVPERGWNHPVRVCNNCLSDNTKKK